MSQRKNSNPATFDPVGTSSYSKPRSLSVGSRGQRQVLNNVASRGRRRPSSATPLQQSAPTELNPYFLVAGDLTNLADKSHLSHVVRRRILVEPVFGKQKRTTGTTENQFRQIILDQGITDESLVDEIKRGAENAYDLGTPQPLRNVHDYVDYSSESLVHGYFKQHATGNLLLSDAFRYAILFVILWNTVLIGLETHPTLSLRYATEFEAMENVIMAAFIIEILIKWYYNFDVFWKGGWNILDFVIVCVLFFGSNWHFLGTSRVLRILRVVRAFRSLRDTPLFSGLSLIFQTVTRSLPDMVNICLLMALVICLLGVVGVILFGEFAPQSFGTFSDAVFTIFICQTQRGWISIFNPFIAAGGGYYVGAFFYFVVTITLTAFILKNMFVAVVVSNLKIEMRLAKAERQRHETKKDNTRAAITVGSLDEQEAEAEEKEQDAGEARNTLEPMVELAHGWKSGEKQQRILLSMFMDGITLEEYQKFLFLQVALEQNLEKYRTLRSRFKEVNEAVHAMNVSYFRDLREKAPAYPQAPKRRSRVQSKG